MSYEPIFTDPHMRGWMTTWRNALVSGTYAENKFYLRVVDNSIPGSPLTTYCPLGLLAHLHNPSLPWQVHRQLSGNRTAYRISAQHTINLPASTVYDMFQLDAEEASPVTHLGPWRRLEQYVLGLNDCRGGGFAAVAAWLTGQL